jgi:uncharacterized protein YydD (DUF2326 family)
MRLLKLSSDNPKFKTLEFSKGLNIVLGSQITKDKKKSINGIGKSLSLNLIHYLLGAEPPKKLKVFLSEYGTLRLNFEHKNQSYVVEKNFSESYFYINDEKIGSTKYTKKLSQIFLDEAIPISFRQMFNCFARRFEEDTDYYSNALKQQSRPLQDYEQRFVNLYLLGVDISLVEKKCQIKDKLKNLNDGLKGIENYTNSENAGTLKDLQDEIDNLTQALSDSAVAPNYEKLKKQADDLTTELDGKRTDIYFLENQLKKKQKILRSLNNINVDIEEITSIYQEAQFFFESAITKRLSDAQNFHNNLVSNRKQRLKTEIYKLKNEIKQLTVEQKSLGEQRDNLLKILEKRGALEERDSITKRITSLELQKNELEKYENLRNTIQKELSDKNAENADVQKDAFTYLEQEQELLDSIENKFRGLVKKFYDNHGGSLQVETAKDAKYLFNILVDIPRDGSQGRKEVKIFCYDVLLYLLNKDLLGFLAHDSCIFSEMDHRQKTTIFKVALEFCQKEGLQYFVNVSENTLNDVLKNDILTEQEKKTIQKSIILELYDKNPDTWLFGESFD